MSLKIENYFEAKTIPNEYHIKKKKQIKGKLNLYTMENEKTQHHLKTLNSTVNFRDYVNDKIINKHSFPIFERNRTNEKSELKRIRTKKEITPSFYTSYTSLNEQKDTNTLLLELNQIKNEDNIITKELNYFKKNYKLLIQDNLTNKCFIEKIINSDINNDSSNNSKISINLKYGNKEEPKLNFYKNKNFSKKELLKRRNSSKSSGLNSVRRRKNKSREELDSLSISNLKHDRKINVLKKILIYFDEKFTNQTKILEDLKNNERAKNYLNIEKLINEEKKEIKKLLEEKFEKEKEDKKLENKKNVLNKMIQKMKGNVKVAEKEVKTKADEIKYIEEKCEIFQKEKKDLKNIKNKLDEQKNETEKDKNKIDEELKEIDKFLEENKSIIKEKQKNEKELKYLNLEENT